jgi:hypothetical protein
VARATIVEALDLPELVQHSDHIVIGTVLATQARYDAYGRIVTDATLRVETTMKGSSSPGGTLVVRRLGGVIGDLGMRVEGEPTLTTGDRRLLFLRDYGAHCRAVGMSQGAVRIEQDPTGRTMALPNGEGLALVQPRSPGALQSSPGPNAVPATHAGHATRAGAGAGSTSGLIPAPAAILHPEPLADLTDRIRALVRSQSVRSDESPRGVAP